MEKIMENEIRLNPKKLEKYVSSIFESVGVNQIYSKIITKSLIEADLCGIRSHGVDRIPIYLKRIELKLVNPNPQIKIIKEKPSISVIDGDYGLGQIVGYEAMKLAIQKAKKTGIGIVGVNKSHHYGMAAFYAKMALEKKMIGFTCSNTTPLMPAPGGMQRAVGSNPFAFAIPGKSDLPIIFDMACSVVAQGKLTIAKEKKEKIPVGWAVNSKGEETTDPIEALKGFILPIAGPKGYGLSMIVDVLSGVLTNAGYGSKVTSLYNDLENKQDCGHLFMALNIEDFIDQNIFSNNIEKYLDEIKNGKKAKGVEEIFIPGEIEANAKKNNLLKGIPLTKDLCNELKNIGEKLNIKIEI